MTISNRTTHLDREPRSALELRSVTAGYGATTVLRDVSLRVPAATVVALLGPNGAGKTTLLRTAAGLQRPTSGEVLLHGAPTLGTRPWQRARRGAVLIPEGRSVFPNLTVRENLRVQMPAGRRGDIAPALDAFPDLKRHLDKRAGNLSGGQQQMVSLSRCFTTSPSVVMLDEVSMGLAPLIVDQIFEALSQLAANGVALLLVEQYVARALEIADHVYILERGQVAFDGLAGDLDEKSLVQRYLHLGSDLSRQPH
jgi:branched-chain amino acid transport system ATP-binding protein